jgi:hypothetical protein
VHRGCVDAASTTFENIATKMINATKNIDILDWIFIVTLLFNLNLESIFNGNVEGNFVFVFFQEIEMFQFS